MRAERIAVIPNPIDDAVVLPCQNGASRRQKGSSTSPLERRKGVEHLIDAFALVLRRYRTPHSGSSGRIIHPGPAACP